MTLAIEPIVLFANRPLSPFVPDFGDLDLARSTREPREMAQTIVDELRPDFPTVLHEPRTYVVPTGLEDLVEDPESIPLETGASRGFRPKQ